MGDPDLRTAIETIEAMGNLPVGEAARHLLICYRAASAETREALVLALGAALCTARQRLELDRRAT